MIVASNDFISNHVDKVIRETALTVTAPTPKAKTSVMEVTVMATPA